MHHGHYGKSRAGGAHRRGDRDLSVLLRRRRLSGVGPGITPLVGIGVEAILTVLLVWAVIGTAVDGRGPKIGSMAIGLAVAADILVGGPLTGAAMNPARWFGPAVAAGAFADWYVWWIGPVLGAAVAALLYRYTLAESS